MIFKNITMFCSSITTTALTSLENFSTDFSYLPVLVQKYNVAVKTNTVELFRRRIIRIIFMGNKR